MEGRKQERRFFSKFHRWVLSPKSDGDSEKVNKFREQRSQQRKALRKRQDQELIAFVREAVLRDSLGRDSHTVGV